MTTTEPTTENGIDVYVALERLPLVQMSEHTRQWIAKVNEIIEEVAGPISHARDLVAMHEAQASIILADLKQNLPERPTELDDGLYELMGILSGSRELGLRLNYLAELADPDTIGPVEVEEARERIENGARLNGMESDPMVVQEAEMRKRREEGQR